MVELSCHGGLYVVQRVLRACLSKGASAAQPGEFTKRAFLNGKLDLTRAEAVPPTAIGVDTAAMVLPWLIYRPSFPRGLYNFLLYHTPSPFGKYSSFAPI